MGGYQQALSTLHKLESKIEMAGAEFDWAAIRLLALKAEAFEAAGKVRVVTVKWLV